MALRRPDFNRITVPMKRIDAFEKVTGKAVYADDMKLDRMLFAKPLYAEHPHAKIIDIDLAEAKTIPGVIDIITAGDSPGSKQVGGVIRDHYVLAFEKVRYHGDVVAVVAAETYQSATEAVEKIRVNYEVLPPILDPLKALKNDPAKVHDERDNNTVESFKIRYGNTEKAFEGAKNVFKATYQTQTVEHAYMERESCVAMKNPDGTITVYGGMQHPFSTRRYVATFLGLPLNHIRVIQTTLGGGFGGKDDTISVVCARAALLALRTERPVKLTLTREESIRESYKRHPFHIELKMAVDDEHNIKALKSYFVADGGPYCAVSPFVIWRPTVQCTGPYKVPNVHCDSFAVYSNNAFSGAMRGFGTPQYNFAIESFIDEVAHTLEVDPIKFRKDNFFQQNDRTHTGQQLAGHKVSIAETVTECLNKFSWDEKYKKCSRGKPTDNKFYGVGMACSYRGVSLGAEGNDFCSAIVNIQPDGSILLEVGVSENGQGSKTAMTRILAGELGIETKHITYLDSDTSSITDGGPTVASRGTLVGGNAVLDAAHQIKTMMEPVIGKLIGKSKQGFLFYKDTIQNPRTKKEISFAEAVTACHNERLYLYALGIWRGPKVGWDEEKGRGDAYFTYVYGCNATEVEIDAETGKVKVLYAVGAHDVGRAINPQMLVGQIQGGMVMGMGQALFEEVKSEAGVIQNTNLNKYKIPRTTDTPPMDAVIVQNPDPSGPWGAKSIGEPTNELMAGAIANAVFNATGVRIRSLPVRPETIIQGLQKEPNSTTL